MKIFYVLNNRFPTPRAHGIQVAKTCAGFSKLGVNVELIVPRRKISGVGVDLFAYYKIPQSSFLIHYLPSLDTVSHGLQGKFSFILQQLLFAVCATSYLLFRKGVIYTRDPFSAVLLSLLGKTVFWEAHTLPKHFNSVLYSLLLATCRGVVAISKGLEEALVANGVNPEKICVAHDGIDLEQFGQTTTKLLHTKLGLPTSQKIVLYSGQLLDWKGVDTLVAAAQLLPSFITTVIIGGPEGQIPTLQGRDTGHRVAFLGPQPYVTIPSYLGSADVLVGPNKQDHGVSEFYTSPLKIFEYMASGKPIIASDLPSIREVLNDQNAVLVDPDNPQALAEAIENTLSDSYSEKRAQQATLDVKKYTWENRAATILKFISRR